MTEAIITTEDLTVYYGKQRGIDGVDLQVQKGEVFGFLGPNGAGKTTTQRVLLDLIRPIRGRAEIFGLDCQTEGAAIRERVGYLPGELSLYENMTAHEYFDLIGGVRGRVNDRAYRRQLCEQLDLDPTRRMCAYSRRNKQKVGVVAAFLSEPDLLILDEPTTSLDPLVQRRVLELVRAVRDEGRTVFFSSHVLSEVQAVCDRVGIIREGRLVTTERIDALTERNFRRVRMWFDQTPQPDAFKLEGVKLIEAHENALTFEVYDRMDRFLRAAVEQGLQDIETLPVTLEEVFLAFYGGEE
ncbi:MAG: ABC transporter ATP-binding protein [Anaerolineales bacterium]|nr:ABC transporter ATP-binding protein [Anaerolineales bacterium]